MRINVYDDGKIIGTVDIRDVIWTDNWGGARIGDEWQEGIVEYKGKEIPVMSDGDETYAIIEVERNV